MSSETKKVNLETKKVNLETMSPLKLVLENCGKCHEVITRKIWAYEGNVRVKTFWKLLRVWHCPCCGHCFAGEELAIEDLYLGLWRDGKAK